MSPTDFLCGRLNNGIPKIFTWTCKYFTLNGHRNLAGVVKALEMKRLSQIIWVGQTESQGSLQEGKRKALKLKEGPWAKECKWPLEAGKGKEIDSPLETSEGIHPTEPLNLAQWDPFQTSDLLICKMRNLSRFKPFSLSGYLTTALGNKPWPLFLQSQFQLEFLLKLWLERSPALLPSHAC